MAIHPATVEIIRNRLESITREMCITIRQTAYSVTMYSGGDFSAGIFDGSGQLVSLSTKVPLHIMPILWEVRAALEKYRDDIRPGDIFMSNSPYHGGSHTPDVNVFLPVFADDELLFFTATRSHWTDVGGMTPGSISGQATEIYQEGLRFPVVKVGEDGEVLPLVLDIIAANVRLPREALGDFRAQIAAGRTGERYLRELVAKYGRDVVVEAVASFLDAAERRTRLLLEREPERTVSHVDYLDNDGIAGDAIRLKATVHMRKDGVCVDYTGSSPQVQGPINTPASGSAGMAYVAIKAFLDPQGPLNHGFFRPIKVIHPAGTVVNPNLPAPTGGYSEVCYTLVNVVLAALADIDPERAAACGAATSNHQYVAGTHPVTKERFIYYDYQPGGCGGTGRSDGLGTTRDLASGFSMLQSMEMLESSFPMRIRRHEARVDSGGPGRFRGGLGHTRDSQVFGSNGSLSAIGEHVVIPPFGLGSGLSGAPGEWRVMDTVDAVPRPISAFGGKISELPLVDGAIVRLATAGGGGFGDPLERDPAAVRADVVSGYVSPPAAKADYGVVLAEGLEVDLAATKRHRARLRRRRVYLDVALTDEDPRASGINVAVVHPGILRGAGKRHFCDGVLAELVATTHVAALRVLLRGDPAMPEGTIRIGREDTEILGVGSGSRIQVRRLRSG